ncbi:thiol-disulfide oxidoreductase DCC family protein [Marinimicrobium sp. ARAG 43.8]|uniref:thiol-disulfide oxidoreductase DCC family protein n=1 Tax=Marinimicrobium sp. ARAG 43.8 TaxID=3418719 RepID=UPI003CF50FFE
MFRDRHSKFPVWARQTGGREGRKETTATLYYDGRSALCRREMALLSRFKSEGLLLLDVHRQWDLSPARREAMLRQLHLRLPGGQWLTGVEANVAAWSFTRFGRYLAPLRWRGVAPLVDQLYRRWAERRFNKVYAHGKFVSHLPDAQNDP